MIQRLIHTATLMIVAIPLSASATTRRELITQLDKIGIDIRTSESCGVKHQNNYATYHYSLNQICLSTTSSKDKTLLDQSLTHESMHVVQDCVAGIDNQYYIPLTAYYRKINVDPEKIARWRKAVLAELKRRETIEHVRNVALDSHHADIEAEAYAFENHPKDVVALLKAFC